MLNASPNTCLEKDETCVQRYINSCQIMKMKAETTNSYSWLDSCNMKPNTLHEHEIERQTLKFGCHMLKGG